MYTEEQTTRPHDCSLKNNINSLPISLNQCKAKLKCELMDNGYKFSLFVGVPSLSTQWAFVKRR